MTCGWCFTLCSHKHCLLASFIPLWFGFFGSDLIWNQSLVCAELSTPTSKSKSKWKIHWQHHNIKIVSVEYNLKHSWYLWITSGLTSWEIKKIISSYSFKLFFVLISMLYSYFVKVFQDLSFIKAQAYEDDGW